MASGRVWVLNFDAEDEMARPTATTSSEAMRARVASLAQRTGSLLPEGDVVLEPATPRACSEGLAGRAWCPTPRALRALHAAGARVPVAPAFDVIRRVNHREFCAALGATLPGAGFARTPAEVARLVAGASPTGRWVLKRAFGYAGRGRRRVSAGELDDGARAWVAASCARHGGLAVEPWVERCGDFARHGFVARDGDVALGEPAIQRVDAHGAWVATERAGDDALDAGERGALDAHAREAAHALRDAGYHGPFGIDAFRWRDAAGAPRFNPRCEINARYSMGYAVGMGALRPDLDE